MQMVIEVLRKVVCLRKVSRRAPWKHRQAHLPLRGAASIVHVRGNCLGMFAASVALKREIHVSSNWTGPDI